MYFKNRIKYIGLFILLFNIVELSNAQPTSLGKPKSVELTKEQKELDEKNRNCIKRNKYSPASRVKLFPFNSATHVKLVSFEGILEKSIKKETDAPIDSTNQNKLKDIITLNKKQIDSLTDILYNVGYRGKFYTIEEKNCYIPRNAILFVNSIGKIFAFIEICFECSGNRLSSKGIKTGDFCEQKYTLLQDFFTKMGVASSPKH
jgi:hypothetical protein